jgi:hypothetical protein
MEACDHIISQAERVTIVMTKNINEEHASDQDI